MTDDFLNGLVSDGSNDASLSIDRSKTPWRITCTGDWTIGKINKVNSTLTKLANEDYPAVEIDSDAVGEIDTAGAWLIERLRRQTVDANKKFSHFDSNPKHLQLVNVVKVEDEEDVLAADVQKTRPNVALTALDKIGRSVVVFGQDFVSGCYLIGTAIKGPQLKAGRSRGIRVKSIMNQLDQMGWKAIPVIVVMSFLIGAIIAQQGAYQLRQFGEELLTVELVAVLHFREIGVLLTAIMVAGRSGSAITAELGIMKMREEIDALHVMGLNPVGVLILPRLTALMIALPILTLLSDVAGILGAMTISEIYVGITPSQFIDVLREGDWSNTIMAGLIKAPFMAMIIGITASVEGMKVGGSSESLGERTTAAVVRSIFAVILVDGIFAIFYAAIGY